MSITKKWSTGPLGNEYPDHSERGNPNTRGLTDNGIPGVEGYVEEDRVVASEDNRPLKNLTQNDQILENNLVDVASEVDYGVLKDKYDEFDLEIQELDYHQDPESDNPDDVVEITPLRIKSGSSFIDGQVTRTGNQQIIYFLRDDESYLFPDYDEHQGEVVIELFDKDYFGEYRPVYNTLAEELPSNFTDYEIKITNTDSSGSLEDRTSYYKVYRDWEDIVPYPPEEESQSQVLDFEYDANYGQDSEGVWLNPENDVINIKVSDVEVKKNIQVLDKHLRHNDFKLNPSTGNYEQILITDGIFFDNIRWDTSGEVVDIQDLVVDKDDNIFFIYDPYKLNLGEIDTLLLYKLSAESEQIDNIEITNILPTEKPMRLKLIDGYLFVLGEGALIKFLDIYVSSTVNEFITPLTGDTTQTFKDVVIWDDTLWIASNNTLYYTSWEDFKTSPRHATFTTIDFASEIESQGHADTLDYIQNIFTLKGNYVVDSSLIHDIDNIIDNPSFEEGGINNPPTSWDVTSSSGSATLKVASGNAQIGQMRAVLQPAINDNEISVYQDKKFDFETSQDYTFSIYLKASTDTDVDIILSELDDSDAIVDSTTQSETVTGNDTWIRFSVTHTVTDSTSVKLRVEVKKTDVNVLQFDGGQLELGASVSQFVHGYNYLFITFRKKDDTTNPPFAIIDERKKYDIQYTPNLYGKIQSINDILDRNHNEIYFIDDSHIYSMQLLNDVDHYDRINISNLSSQLFGDDFRERVKQLYSIEELNSRIYIGGTILNKNISFTIDDGETHTVELLHANEVTGGGSYLDFLTIIGDYNFIQASENSPARVEFSRTEELYESQNPTPTEGFYSAEQIYAFGIRIDDIEYLIKVDSAPQEFNSPWSIEDVYNKIVTHTTSEGYDVFSWHFDNSTLIVDGLYSIGMNKPTRYLRGNIKKIFKQENAEEKDVNERHLYIARENTIIRSKYDPNIKKVGDSYPSEPVVRGYVDSMDDLPSDPDNNDVYYVEGWGYFKWIESTSEWIDTHYFHRWDISDSNYELREFTKIANETITFNDTTHNRLFVDIPVSSGCELLTGSVRLKINDETEYGFIEGKDYFINYENKTVIRNDGKNLLSDSKLEHIDDPSTQWNIWSTHDDPEFNSLTNEFNEIFAEFYTVNQITEYVNFHQVVVPNTLSVGETFTFSIYVKSNIEFTSGNIRLAERINSGTNKNDLSLFYDDFIDGSTQTFFISNSELDIGKWHRIEVTHTIQNTESDCLRVEFYSALNHQIFVKNAQLEENPFATPYVPEEGFSRIDPQDTVYCDFIEYKVLTEGSDYTFNTDDNRRICLLNPIGSNSELYFDYEYERIFNPYKYGNSLPTFDVRYDNRDDYFLYENSGRIWAINQILALLSLDESLNVSYKYHYPRIDKIKIRNIPDKYGNFLYIVKGDFDVENPYSPGDLGNQRQVYVDGVYDVSIDDVNNEDNDVLYELNVVDLNFNKNDIYDRRIFIDSDTSPYFSISLQNETLAYFPFVKDFISTNGIHPLNQIDASRIVSIVKNYSIQQNEEVGAWGTDYQMSLRYKDGYPENIGPSLSTFVDNDNGKDDDPAYDGTSQLLAFKTIGRAVEAIRDEGAQPNIVIISTSTITEDVEIDLTQEILIKAKTYTRWRGNLQNRSKITFQGIIFENFNFYAIADLDFYHCNLEDSSINNYYPLNISLYNCKILDATNTFLRISSQLFPTPFAHPYMRNITRDDGVPGSPESVATSDGEAIHPEDLQYNFELFGDPIGNYTMYRCLMNGLSDDLIHYDLTNTQDWISNFDVEKCTIVNSKLLFKTSKPGQSILFNECIVWNNGEIRSGEKKYFDSRSNIEFLNSFIDFSVDPELVPASELNFNPIGGIFGRETCQFSGPNKDPGFISTDEETEDYHLRSIAKGFLTDSVCIGKASDGKDIGCYDEIRERVDLDVPKKFKSNFAYIAESIHYPIVVNSEKITFTVEFKPTETYNNTGILFDTRSDTDDDDYIVLLYNNNTGEKRANLTPDSQAEPSDPYTFKIIVANKYKKYAVISPLQILSDADYQQWHKISFTVNYEKAFNQKPAFDEKDKYQNIITFYHNNQLAIESFIVNDLNRDEKGELILNELAQGNEIVEGFKEEETTNAWNYNDISYYITIGGAFDQTQLLSGYYSELRIDNKFTNRKELTYWNDKELPFIDPTNYIDQSTFVKTIDSRILNEFWSLKNEYGIGAKGNTFEDKTRKRFTYLNSELVWALMEPTMNYLENSDFTENEFAHIITDVPPRLNSNISKYMFISTTGSRIATDNAQSTINDDAYGISVRFFTDEDDYANGMNFYSAKELVDHINDEIFRTDGGTPVNGNTYIRCRLRKDGKIEFYTKDWQATSIKIQFENSGDHREIGFNNDNPDLIDWEYMGELQGDEANVYFIDTLRSDSYVPDGSPAYPFKSFFAAKSQLEVGYVLYIANGETNPGSTYADFGITTGGGGGTVLFTGRQITKTKDTNFEILGLDGDTVGRHEVWNEFDPLYTRLSNRSWGILKNRALGEDETITIYFEKITQTGGAPIDFVPGEYYTFSMYVYSEDEVSSEKIKFIKRENGTETEFFFDDIEKIYGSWMKLTKTTSFSSDLQADIGIIVKRDIEFYIDAVQLERSKFSTPYIKERNDNHGVIEISRALVQKQRGIIFFRFKPIINFDTEDEIVLLEAVKYQIDEAGDLVYKEGSDVPLVDWNRGFRISYYYDPTIEKGIITFKTDSLVINDTSTHKFYIVESLWDYWHSVAIYYDYPTNRFIYYFDHFKYDTESGAAVQPFASNFYIGRDVPKDYTSSGSFEWTDSIGYDETKNRPSANILVKDVIITNYPISDRELSNWKNIQEFYKESSYIHLLDYYQDQVLQRISNLELVSENTIEISNKIDSFEQQINQFEENLNNNVNTQLPQIESDIATNAANITTNADDIDVLELNVSNLTAEQSNQDGRITQNESDIDYNYNLILAETQARIDADDIIVNRLISNNIGDGASTVGIADTNNRFSATNVENALQELAGVDRDATHTVKGNYDLIQTNITTLTDLQEDVQYALDANTGSWTQVKATNNGWNIADLRTDVTTNAGDITTNAGDIAQEIIDRANADQQIRDDLISTDNGKGASLIGVEDSNGVLTEINLEAALYEIIGSGRTNQTIKDNWDLIQTNISDITDIQNDVSNINTDLLEIGKMKDGTDGSTWDSSMNLKDHEDRLDTAETNISTNASDIDTNETDIANTLSYAQGVRTDLTTEISNRQQGDQDIRNDLASTSATKGASMVGVKDENGYFTENTVEEVLSELDEKIQTLETSLNWKEPVDTVGDLPTTGNDDGDARTVLDDGDGFAAQYVWNGTSWVKIADINWGTASDISYTNTTTGMDATNVQSAIDEVYERSQDPSKAEDEVETTDYSSSGGRYFYDIDHELNTQDVTVIPISKTDGRVVGVDEIEAVDFNTTRVWVTDNSEGLNFIVFGAVHNYSKTVGSWTPSSGTYYHTVNHNLNSQQLLLSVFDLSTGHRVNLDEILFTDDNTITLWTSDNLLQVNVFVLKRTSDTKVKDIDNWNPVAGMYEASIKMPEDYDAVYQFIDPSTGRIVGVDDVWFDGDYLKVRSSDDSRLRMVILR